MIVSLSFISSWGIEVRWGEATLVQRQICLYVSSLFESGSVPVREKRQGRVQRRHFREKEGDVHNSGWKRQRHTPIHTHTHTQIETEHLNEYVCKQSDDVLRLCCVS